ncbi:MAG: hypothetical protein II822_07775 [Prevotella sp.]|nr:hypothetical protein [Prevotella sp.]
MKKIIFLFAILVLCQSSVLGQKKYKMVIEKANGSQVVLNLKDISRISIPEIDDNVYLTCPDENHPHIIDLGLPSKTLWACCNTGSAKPEAYGGYYAWGETETKHDYKQSTYKYYNGKEYIFIGNDIVGTQYDAATADWGAPWRMPTNDETLELKANTTIEEVELNGVKGKKFTGANGGSIFLPYAGIITDQGEWGQGQYGHYWSSTLWEDLGPCEFHFFGGGIVIAGRENGNTIRPVRSK